MSEKKEKSHANKNSAVTVESPPGICRTTLAYRDEIMFCHFDMKKGASIPLHNHEAVQCGYVIQGKVKFVKQNESEFIAEAGDSYVFASKESHGADVLEDSEVVECFAPMRPEYA